MALFIESEIRNRAKLEIRKSFLKTASQIILESTEEYSTFKTYDIFLSHSFKDSELILGLKNILEDFGYSVFVDWIDDPQLDRSHVSKETAKKLRERMQSSKSLFFVTTENANNSKWMPWECGYFDGIKEKVAILPIKKTSTNNAFNGQEYLGLYPYVVKQKSTSDDIKLWIHLNVILYTSYDNWVNTSNDMIKWKES